MMQEMCIVRKLDSDKCMVCILCQYYLKVTNFRGY